MLRSNNSIVFLPEFQTCTNGPVRENRSLFRWHDIRYISHSVSQSSANYYANANIDNIVAFQAQAGTTRPAWRIELCRAQSMCFRRHYRHTFCPPASNAPFHDATTRALRHQLVARTSLVALHSESSTIHHQMNVAVSHYSSSRRIEVYFGPGCRNTAVFLCSIFAVTHITTSS